MKNHINQYNILQINLGSMIETLTQLHQTTKKIPTRL